jgi:hypothetical protein
MMMMMVIITGVAGATGGRTRSSLGLPALSPSSAPPTPPRSSPHAHNSSSSSPAAVTTTTPGHTSINTTNTNTISSAVNVSGHRSPTHLTLQSPLNNTTPITSSSSSLSLVRLPVAPPLTIPSNST